MASDVERRCVFAVAHRKDGGFALLVGIPERVYSEEMAQPNSTNIVLDRLGIPFSVSMFRCKDHADGLKFIEGVASELDITLDDQRRSPFEAKE